MSERGPYAKGIAKREEILDAATAVFVENGYDRTSVREIARRTGLSQAGLLHHFSTKEGLFLEVLRRRDDRAPDSVEATHSHSVDRLIGAVDRNAQEPGLVRLFVALSAESAEEGSVAQEFFMARYRWLLAEIAEDVRHHQMNGDLSPLLDPDDIASILVAAADGLQVQWLLDPEGVDMSARIRALWDALRRF